MWLDEKNPNWELAAHPNASCMPHVGAGTKETQQYIGSELVNIVSQFAVDCGHNSNSEVLLDPEQEHYYFEIRPKA